MGVILKSEDKEAAFENGAILKFEDAEKDFGSSAFRSYSLFYYPQVRIFKSIEDTI